jgi:hypothetical protein
MDSAAKSLEFCLLLNSKKISLHIFHKRTLTIQYTYGDHVQNNLGILGIKRGFFWEEAEEKKNIALDVCGFMIIWRETKYIH